MYETVLGYSRSSRANHNLGWSCHLVMSTLKVILWTAGESTNLLHDVDIWIEAPGLRDVSMLVGPSHHAVAFQTTRDFRPLH